MTTPHYIVHYHCHVCGRMHLVSSAFPLPGGPTEPCTLADLYPAGNFPPRVVRFLTNYLLWCDQANDYIERDDPARLHLTPRPGALHLPSKVHCT